MTKYSGSGWHNQSIRHSNARKYGRAGGKYSFVNSLPIYQIKGKQYYRDVRLGEYRNVKDPNDKLDINIPNSMLQKPTMPHPADNKKKFISEFENMLENAELRALSNLSLQRPLNDKEYERFMELGRKAGIIIEQHPKTHPAGWYDIGHTKHYGKTELSAPLKKESTELSIQFSINVPSTKNIDEPISTKEFQERIDETKNFLSKNFGGDTEIKGKGDYTKDGRLIQDDVSVIESSMKPEAYKENKKKLEEYITKKQKEWTQDTILYNFEDSAYIYPAFS
jgi:hypothetical protein